MKISLLTPTRGRVKGLKDMIKSVVDTTEDLSKTEICLYVDDDDKVTLDYLSRVNAEFSSIGIKTYVGPRIILSQCWNKAYEISCGDILFLNNDDVVFETKGWDVIVRKRFEKNHDKILLLFGDDGIQGNKMATLPFVSRVASTIVGRYVPPYFRFGYNDFWLHRVYLGLQRLFHVPEMKIKHHHHSRYKEFNDETTREGRSHKQESKGEWEKHCHEIQEDISKLKEYIGAWSR